jgi:O-antigen/teichoic acid export membrane protein
MQVQDLSSTSHPEKPGVLKEEQAPKAGLSFSDSLSWSYIHRVGLSIADQTLSVGGMFLVNVALARVQTKEEYGIFALSYSVFTFLTGLHNAAILEAYTIFGSGRYRQRFHEYAPTLWRANGLLGLAFTGVAVLIWFGLLWLDRPLASRSLLGMATTCGVLVSASFVRRSFYIRRRPDLAAKFSLIFFLSCAALLWLSIRTGVLDGFSAFLIAALAWIVAGVFLVRELPEKTANQSFMELEPGYWSEHWKYSRWVFVTAFVFQFTTQGYYWLAAGFLAVKEVGNLRAMVNLVTPVDQLFTAMNLLILPVMCSRYAAGRRDGLLQVWKFYCAGWFLATCGFAGLVNLVGRSVMHGLYGGKFDNVASLLGTLAVLPVVMGIGHTVNSALKAAERPNLVFYAYVLSGAATFLLGIPLVIHFGLRGAVYGMLLSGATYTGALALGFLWTMRSQVYRTAMNSRER